MDTLLETGNRRHSRMALMAARAQSMPPSAVPRLWSPEGTPPSDAPQLWSPGEKRPSVVAETGEGPSIQRSSRFVEDLHSKDNRHHRVAPRRVSKLGKCLRPKKKAPLVIVLQTDGNSSRYSLVNRNEMVKVTRQMSNLEKPLPPCPPGYDQAMQNDSGASATAAQNLFRQNEFDLEAQREKTERCRFWILATFTVITGLGTIVLVLIEVLDFFPELKGGGDGKSGGE